MVKLGPIRVIALDTVRPGQSGGQLDAPRLAWVEAALAADRTTPTLLAMHHPPLDIGQSGIDATGIPEGERRTLGAILAQTPRCTGSSAGTSTAPSSATSTARRPGRSEHRRPAGRRLRDRLTRFAPETASFAIHIVVGGRIVSHLPPIR